MESKNVGISPEGAAIFSRGQYNAKRARNTIFIWALLRHDKDTKKDFYSHLKISSNHLLKVINFVGERYTDLTSTLSGP